MRYKEEATDTSKYIWETVKGFAATKERIVYRDLTIRVKKDAKGTTISIGDENTMFIVNNVDLMKLLKEVQ